MRLADRYILTELLLFFLGSTAAVLTLMLGIVFLFQHPQWDTLPSVIPYYISLTLPVAIALASSLVVNRMARDNELTVLRGTGTPLARAFLPILIIGLAVSILDYVLFDRVLPFEVQRQLAPFGQTLEPPSPGATFVVDRYTISYSGSQRLSASKRHMTKLVIMETPANPGMPFQIITADSADYEYGIWQMQQVIYHSFSLNGITQAERRGATGQLRLTVDFSNLYRRPDSAQEEYTFPELIQRAREAARLGNRQDAIAYEVDAWTKLALPAMAFVFTLFATPLALRFARTGSFSGVMLSIGTVFVAWNTLLLMQYVGYGGYLPPAVSAWATDLLFGIPGLFLFYRADRS
jgi:lipopolysaccharide export LptBFGC system permease protein LptF